MSITDPLQTIVSILKNASTGLNSTGYEIHKDNGSTECTLLVTYPMSKEKLTALFGGSADIDVVIVCESGEGTTEPIGSTVNLHTIPVTITIHVIEKHSAVGSAKKIVTPELVRWKAKNAISAFIKANVNAPGGSIGVWVEVADSIEQDISVRPIIYKHVIETEARCYR